MSEWALCHLRFNKVDPKVERVKHLFSMERKVRSARCFQKKQVFFCDDRYGFLDIA